MSESRNIISKLKFIGKIQKGEKINIKYMYIQPQGFVTQLSRTFVNQCNRTNALNFIRETIYKSFIIYKELEKDIIRTEQKSIDSIDKKSTLVYLKTDIDNAKKGIINIKNTYIDDVKLSCDFDKLLQEIEAFLLLTNKNDTEDDENDEE